MSSLRLQLYVNDRLSHSWDTELPVSVGRQDMGEPPVGPYVGIKGKRAIVAPITSRDIPRRYFRIEYDSHGNPILINDHPHKDVSLTDSTVSTGGSQLVSTPISITLSDSRRLRILSTEVQDGEMRSLSGKPLDPMAVSIASIIDSKGGHTIENAGALDGISGMLQQVLPVVRESVSSDSFFEAAALAAVRIANVDRAIVILIDGDSHEARAEVYRDSPGVTESSLLRRAAPDISDTIVQSTCDSGTTKIYESGMGGSLLGNSLQVLHQAMCAPILDKDRTVVGVLYGDRWTGTVGQQATDVEAKLLEILACAVAAGLARQAEERQRTSMEIFFSDIVAKHIFEDATLLDAKEETVTLMFCDVREFSAISKSLGPIKTVQWMQDMFTVLSECVEGTHGIVINYVGDELIAMWGAPEPQIDHAARCLTASQNMMRSLESLEQRWRDDLSSPLRVGIGINSGVAAVGNTGSKTKFQYGVFGNVVNIASRLQSATKQFGVDCLVSQSTVLQAASSFPMRELATIRVVGIDEDIVVKQLMSDAPAYWQDLCSRYEAALEDYREMRFADATHKLGDVLREYPSDEPSMRLLEMSVAQLRSPSECFTPVDTLTQK